MGTTVCPISGREELNSITTKQFLNLDPPRVPLKVGLLDRERPITIDDNEADDDDEKGFVCCDISKPRSGSEGRDRALIFCYIS